MRTRRVDNSLRIQLEIDPVNDLVERMDSSAFVLLNLTGKRRIAESKRRKTELAFRALRRSSQDCLVPLQLSAPRACRGLSVKSAAGDQRREGTRQLGNFGRG